MAAAAMPSVRCNGCSTTNVRAGLTVSGTYGTGTRDAVAAFQRHMTSTSSGSVDAITWRRLLWHFERPVWGSTSGFVRLQRRSTGRRTGEPVRRSASCVPLRSASTTPATAGWRWRHRAGARRRHPGPRHARAGARR
jgi:hypothetical protein